MCEGIDDSIVLNKRLEWIQELQESVEHGTFWKEKEKLKL